MRGAGERVPSVPGRRGGGGGGGEGGGGKEEEEEEKRRRKKGGGRGGEEKHQPQVTSTRQRCSNSLPLLPHPCTQRQRYKEGGGGTRIKRPEEEEKRGEISRRRQVLLYLGRRDSWAAAAVSRKEFIRPLTSPCHRYAEHQWHLSPSAGEGNGDARKRNRRSDSPPAPPCSRFGGRKGKLRQEARIRGELVAKNPDPGWASINRGVLICDECCSVHRSLGRHISIVKHLRHSPWPPTLLQMVHTLASNGANSIWEHSLLDPAQVQSGRRKANPQDKVHPIKSEFIRAKYQMLAFVHKLPCRDDDGVTAKDLSKQLHSSVRTGNLETCLRLLSLGAQANFFHPEKGTTPLHVAAKAGQTLQAELLVVYGADPGAPDINGRTPIDYARQAGHQELAERLVECQYELTDRLAFYLCGRKPDHKNGHYIIPQMADRSRQKCMSQSLDLSELAKAAKKKLQALSNRLFEELAMDVYDEVDRRENDAVWLATQNHSTLVTERSAVPFLPVNPEYSATRNQGRQKLARFNAREFATLIIDILSEAKRRQQGKSLSSPTDNLDYSQRSQSDLDDQHDYDSVASDEDTDQEPLRSAGATRNNRARSMDSSDLSDGAVTLQEYLELKKALATSEAKVQQLMKVNSSLSDELRRLQREIHKLQSENSQIRQQSGPAPAAPVPSERAEHGHGGAGGAAPRRDRQAFSMYEPGSALKAFGAQPGDELASRLQPFHSSIRKGVSASSVPFPPSSPLMSCTQDGGRHMSKLSRHGSGADSDYDNTQSGEPLLGLEGKRFLDLGKDEDFHPELETLDGELDPGLPSTEDVILKTEQVTKNIQELLRAAQEFKHDSFVPCSEKIHSAVTEMAALFPKRPSLEPVRSSLRLLNASAYRLQSECRKTVPPEPGAPVDFQLLTQQVIQCAYDIAKAAKQLVTITTREKKQ
ncbi:ARF GTPase-activating protein GIT1 isoform X3 [Dromiciops gliroides]|uniref:ARF GTPase-activating protein GIT1 isoform X3 n=1 Tax=Dromiciops gliroides TaxID=33562 RepID=UPI001CC800CF|nr:ARF GTPase-activating protein GIT1 isoform X3 [Dromiciops gliroides]